LFAEWKRETAKVVAMSQRQKRPNVVERVERLQAKAAGDADVFLKALTVAASDRSVTVRWIVMDELEKAELYAGLSLAEAGLKDKSHMVRASAAKCVGTLLGGSGAAHAGLQLLLTDPDWVVRDDAQESLGWIGDQGALPQIARLLEDEEPVVRSHCATVLADLGGKPYKKLLKAHLAVETAEHPQAGFLTALINLGERALLPRLLEYLESGQYIVRCATANYLGHIDLSASEKRLAVKALRKAEREPIARADQSTAQTVLKSLRSA
jgi:HEAT repeat protein